MRCHHLSGAAGTAPGRPVLLCPTWHMPPVLRSRHHDEGAHVWHVAKLALQHQLILERNTLPY